MNTPRTSSPKLVNVILCDQVRQESTGKLLVIGMYTGTVLLGSCPATIPTLSFVCTWKLPRGSSIDGAFEVLSPEDEPLGSVTVRPQNQPTGDGEATTIIVLSPFTFTTLGEYRLVHRPSNERRRTVYRFTVAPRPDHATTG